MDFSKHSQGQTSVKVHHQPGGQSSFSLAHDDGTGKDDRWGNNGKVGSAANAAPKTSTQAPWAQEEQKKDSPAAGTGTFTSVKYSGNPPGGRSQITF
uniref:Uncharacterized protein n=1 Tax=Strombidium rassoulzadegani TaxID=1082188 RepID=A0A7S3CMG6_9SPIT